MNAYLVDDLPLYEDMLAQVLRTRNIRHDVVFTHADLNMRDSLVDANMKNCGIVDWESTVRCPEYWE